MQKNFHKDLLSSWYPAVFTAAALKDMEQNGTMVAYKLAHWMTGTSSKDPVGIKYPAELVRIVTERKVNFPLDPRAFNHAIEKPWRCCGRFTLMAGDRADDAEEPWVGDGLQYDVVRIRGFNREAHLPRACRFTAALTFSNNYCIATACLQSPHGQKPQYKLLLHTLFQDMPGWSARARVLQFASDDVADNREAVAFDEGASVAPVSEASSSPSPRNQFNYVVSESLKNKLLKTFSSN